MRSSSFHVSDLLSTNRDVTQMCAVNSGNFGPFVVQVDQELQPIQGIDPAIGVTQYKFVEADGGDVAGTHVINTVTGEVLARYDDLRDITSLRKYYLEMCS